MKLFIALTVTLGLITNSFSEPIEVYPVEPQSEFNNGSVLKPEKDKEKEPIEDPATRLKQIEKFQQHQRQIFHSGLQDGALHLSLPILYLGSSIYAYENHFSNRQKDNFMVPTNALALGIGGGALLGGLAAFVISEKMAGTGLGAALATMLIGAIGIVIGGSIGGYIAKQYDHEFEDSRILYYLAPGVVMSLALLTVDF